MSLFLPLQTELYTFRHITQTSCQLRYHDLVNTKGNVQRYQLQEFCQLLEAYRES